MSKFSRLGIGRSSTPIPAYAKLNARCHPTARGRIYEDPLEAELAKAGLGSVTGGGTMQAKDGEILFCGIDLELKQLDKAIPLVCRVLEEQGAPKGSCLQMTNEGKAQEIPFGSTVGLALYFNGVDLPEEVYQNCDIDHVWNEIDRLLGNRGMVQGCWQGPKETALYLYGYSVDDMKDRIDPLMKNYPLCEKARVVALE